MYIERYIEHSLGLHRTQCEHCSLADRGVKATSDDGEALDVKHRTLFDEFWAVSVLKNNSSDDSYVRWVTLDISDVVWMPLEALCFSSDVEAA